MIAWRSAGMAAVLTALASSGATQPVYRCGSEYRPAPCPGGTPVDVSDGRTAAQRREAAQAARTDAHTATQLERERQAREAAAQGPAMGGFYTLPRASGEPASAPVKGKAANRKKKKPRPPSAPSRV